jgi:iron complex outermembrane receptor protein
MKQHLYLISTCACAMMAMPAAAQTTDAPSEQPEANTASAGSGDIIVTARRREETLMDVPLSVSAISGDQLVKSGVTDVQGLQYRTPSLSITSSQSQRNTVAFALRGQRAQETQLFTDAPVGTYFAEVVQPRPYGFGNTFFDLESVQVLKGVQGTLFGRNMTGGAVLVEPAHPKMNEFSGELRGQYGNYDLRDITGSLNVPLGDIGALRFAGKYRRRDGWAHDVSGLDLDNQNQRAFRVSGLLKPFDGFETLTIFDYYKSKERGTAAFLTAIKVPSVLSNYEGLRAAGLISTNVPAQFQEALQLQQHNRYDLNIGAGKGGNLDVFGGPFENIKNWGITNKTTWNLTDELTLKNIFGYRKLRREQVQDYDGIPAFLITPYQFSKSRNVSEELQLQGKVLDGKLDFILGGYYFDEKGVDGSIANTLPELNIAGARLNPRTTDASLFVTANPGSGYSRTAAGFLAGTYHFSDQFSLSAGARYNWDKRRITVSPSQPNLPIAGGGVGRCSFDIDEATPGLQTVPLAQCNFSNSVSFKKWTYDGTLQYQPSSALTTYVSYRRGFRAGGFSTRATSATTLRPFQPEYVKEIELGLKTNNRLGAGRLTTTTALFQQDGSNVQKQRATFVDGNVFTIVDNTAKQRNRGGEFELNYSTDTFQLAAFYSYTKVKIREGRVVLNGLPEFDQRGTPKHQAGATATISPPINEELGKFNVIANYTWRSAIYLDDFEIEGRQKPYSLINLRAELTDINQTGASVALFVNNALDQRYRTGVLGLIAEGLGFQSSVYGERRMYGAEIGYRF